MPDDAPMGHRGIIGQIASVALQRCIRRAGRRESHRHVKQFSRRSLTASTLLIGLACSLPATTQALAAEMDSNSAGTSSSASSTSLEPITITAQRLGLLGTASTASEGVVADQEVQLTPCIVPASCWRPYRV